MNHQRFGLEASPPSAPPRTSPADHDESQVCRFSTSRPNKNPQDYAAEKRSNPSGNRAKSISGRHSPEIGIVTNCMVTFTVDMTPVVNGSVDTNLSFTIGVDSVMLNGLWNGLNPSFWGWANSAPTSFPQYVMTNIPGGNLYTITLPVNQGQPLNLSYDYGIDGLANEPNGNHSHYIRSIPNYAMPTDVFGSPAPGEQSFGNLTVTKANNQVSVSWLGRTGVSLQSATNLNPPIHWTPMPLTDGTNLIVNQGPGTTPPVGYATTNITVGTSNVFYELIGPQ